MPEVETSSGFSQRKKDHIEISLRKESQSTVDQFSTIELQHQAIPEIDFSEVELDCEVFGHPLGSPLFVSSMTLGHGDSLALNQTMASLCEKKGWMMGVGSQRKQLFDPKAYQECERLRQHAPSLILFGNIGLTQLIDTPVEKVESLVQSLNAQFMVVHTNPLQESIQPEGTPHFKGGLKALENICSVLSVPVVLKETGCGISLEAAKMLKSKGLSALDVSGRGGTHWGLVEGMRLEQGSLGNQAAQTFGEWGISTLDSVLNCQEAQIDCEVWASGGVRSGLDAAKLIAVGARKVGFAQPILKAVMQGEQSLENLMERLEFELKIAMFCIGKKSISAACHQRDLWKRK